MRATNVNLTVEQRGIPESRVRQGKTEQRLALRARIILGAAEGQQTAQIARVLAARPAAVSKWRCRFAKEGLAGLEDAARPGKPSIYSQETENRVLSQLDQPPPASYSRWKGRLLAAALGVIHVILDNLNTHKPKRDMWLKRHPRVHLHYTPTSASWLNQIEVWFSILSRSALQGAHFTSPKQIREAIDKFIEVYNPQAAPFQWTKRYVYPKGLKINDANLCN